MSAGVLGTLAKVIREETRSRFRGDLPSVEQPIHETCHE
jgi:hypothetical protein